MRATSTPTTALPLFRHAAHAAAVLVLASCGEPAPTPAPPPAPLLAPASAEPVPEPTPVAPTAPAGDPAHPTMGALRSEATPIVGTESPPAPPRGATLVPQVVHRSAPTVALAASDRVLVVSSRRFTIVERASGAVRAWGTRFAESTTPHAADFAADGSWLEVRGTPYDATFGHELVVEGADGETHTLGLPEHAVAAFVEGGVATADRELHLHTPRLESERTIELDWTTPATRMVVSPDRRLVALENEDGDLRIVHVPRGAIVARLHAEPWAPLTLLRAEEAAARAADAPEEEDDEPLPGDAPEEPLPLEPSAHRAWVALAFSPDGRRFAAVRGDGLSRVLDLTTSHALASIEPAEGAGSSDVTRAGLSADGSILVLAGARGGSFSADTGEPLAAVGAVVEPVEVDLVPHEPFDPAPFLAAPTGGESSVWRAPPIPGLEAFLVAGRFGAVVVGPGVAREIHCVDGEQPIRFEGWPALAIQDRGTCDLRTDEGPVFALEERGGGYTDWEDENDDGEYDEAEEEPEVTIVRGQLAVLGEHGRRTRVPGTEGISEDHVRVVELGGERFLVADDGVSSRTFRIEAPAGLVATLAPGEAPYRATPAALFVTGSTHWRALAADGHELAQLALDAAHAGVTPTPCTSPDGTTIAVGIGATLHVLDAAWHETATLAMPAANGACVHGDRVLVERSHGVVEVWSLAEGRRTAVWSVPEDSLVSLPIGLALVERTISEPAEGVAGVALDVVDLREGRVVRTVDGTGMEETIEETMSDDGRFASWPEDVYARIVRLSDGASLRLGVVRAGREVHAYAVSDEGVFTTIRERSVDLFRVREAGPSGSAPLLDASAGRARFYRPTLLHDFLHDRPLPTPGADGGDAAVPPR